MATGGGVVMGRPFTSWRAALATAALVLALPSSASASDHPANIPWVRLLPPLPSPTEPQPHPVPFCEQPSVGCIDVEISRLEARQRSLGCDHRAVFATTYLELTRALRDTLAEDPRFFRYPTYLFFEDALFADFYFDTLAADARGERIPPAWRIAFDTARSGDANAGQDMLLGINAHVQNDMPFVLAALGLRTPEGASRKMDHDRVNEVLDRAYKPVVRSVAERYDPLLFTTNADWNPLDDVAGLELVKEWREQVWRNAERLLNARTDAQRRSVAADIERYAAVWAGAIAAPGGPPGYRARRDAYCREGEAEAAR